MGYVLGKVMKSHLVWGAIPGQIYAYAAARHLHVSAPIAALLRWLWP